MSHIELLDIRMHDGSRHFVGLRASANWYEVRDHVERLSGAQLTGFVTDGITEAWIDFSFRDHQFSINDQFGEFWFFVANPACPDGILIQVATHFRHILK